MRRRGNAPLWQLVGTGFVVLAGAAAAGALWAHWWTPPGGLAVAGAFVLDENGLAQDFSATGLYVSIALGAGALIGLLLGLAFRGHEVLTVAAALLAAVIGAWVMIRVGHALGPPDPAVAARTAEDLTELAPDLRVHGIGPLLALPSGTMAGLTAAYLIRETIGVIRPHRGNHISNLVS